MTITYVRWKDALSELADHEGRPPKAQLVELEECGFLLDENEEALQIGIENDKPDELCPGRWRISIPKAMILARADMDVEKFLLQSKKKPRRASR